MTGSEMLIAFPSPDKRQMKRWEKILVFCRYSVSGVLLPLWDWLPLESTLMQEAEEVSNAKTLFEFLQIQTNAS